MFYSHFRSTIRALIKNFSIASFFPAFITLLFFQHNRTAYDIVAGTIVVRRNGVRWYQKMRFPDWFWTSPPIPSEQRPIPKLKSRYLSESFAQVVWELIQKLKKMFCSSMMPAATLKVLGVFINAKEVWEKQSLLNLEVLTSDWWGRRWLY